MQKIKKGALILRIAPFFIDKLKIKKLKEIRF